MVSAEYYTKSMRERTSQGSVYAVGLQKYRLDLGPSEVGIVVLYPGLQPTQSPLLPEPVSAFRVDRVGGEWQIVGIDSGTVDLVPSFFKWYAPWGAAFPPG